jgi:hypothetical protein
MTGIEGADDAIEEVIAVTEGPPSVYRVVADQIAGLGQPVFDGVVAHLVGRECNKRIEALTTVIDDLDKQKRAIRGIKPDILAYNEDGSVATAQWSQAKLKERKEALDKSGKYERAINKAFEKNDFKDVYDLAGVKKS